MGRAVIALLLLCACGRLGFDARSDAGADSVPPLDACTFTAWTTPVRVPELSTAAAEFGGQIIGNGLAYYFRSDRGGSTDFYVARRFDRSSAFGTTTKLTELSSGGDEFDISVADDELEVVFSSDRIGGRYCLYRGERAAIADPFTNVTRLDATCASVGSAGGFVTPDRLTMYYVRMDGPNYEGTLMRASRPTTGAAFDAGAAIPELDVTSFAKGYPVLSADGLTLYFDSGTPHHLWEAARTSTAAGFDTPRMMTEVDSNAIDEDVSITADGLELYFSSGRGGGPDDTYRSTRTCQ